ncbi:MAG: hypothetical protein WA715_02990 [Candidatus Acidiferrum sp.]
MFLIRRPTLDVEPQEHRQVADDVGRIAGSDWGTSERPTAYHVCDFDG